MKQRFLQARTRRGPNTVLHLKLYEGENWTTTGPVLNEFDYSLNGHPGTLKGTATFKYPGVDLDGNSDYIEIADHADFTPALTPFSISVWAYMHDATDFQIASKGARPTDGEWWFAADSGDKIFFNCIDQSANAWIGRIYNTGLTSYENQWIHLVATYDGGTLSSGVKIYLNGSCIDDTDDESGTFVAIENLAAAVWVGRKGSDYSDGLLDNVMMHTEVLSASEIRDMYTLEKFRYQT